MTTMHSALIRPALGVDSDAVGGASLIGGDRVTHLLSAVAAWPASFAWLAAPLHSSARVGARAGLGCALGQPPARELRLLRR
jgi:hypothetical protein